MTEVTIKELTGETWGRAARLQLGDGQEKFMASNVESIAWSRYETSLIPAGIFAGDEMMGFVLYGPWPDEPNRWGIARFMIDRNQQGKGYGKAGMKAIIDLIREQHPEATGLKLAYIPGNDRARKLYESVGFRETGEMWDDEIITALDFEPKGADTPATSHKAEEGTAEPKDVTLQPVTLETFMTAVDLKVADHQQMFVAPNVHSIALSRFLTDYEAAGIFAGGEMIGFVFYGPEPENEKWHIARFMIAEKHQGKGYGKAALRLIIDTIVQRSPDTGVVDLTVVPGNETAIRLYASLGFKQTGEIHRGELVMVLDVKNLWKARSNPA